MKTAIYIEDGIVQLVLTPESEFEKNAVASFAERPLDVKVHDGAFYDCRGGWTRQKDFYPQMHGVPNSNDRSIILRIDEAKPKAMEETA